MTRNGKFAPTTIASTLHLRSKEFVPQIRQTTRMSMLKEEPQGMQVTPLHTPHQATVHHMVPVQGTAKAVPPSILRQNIHNSSLAAVATRRMLPLPLAATQAMAQLIPRQVLMEQDIMAASIPLAATHIAIFRP